jgi:hypothetical protein
MFKTHKTFYFFKKHNLNFIKIKSYYEVRLLKKKQIGNARLCPGK